MAGDNQPNPWRYAGMGLELGGAVAVLAVLGWWIDRSFGTAPWALLTGVIIGAVGGMYLFIKDALAATQSGPGGLGAGRGGESAKGDADESEHKRDEP